MDSQLDEDCETWSLISGGSLSDEDDFEIVPRNPESKTQTSDSAKTTSPSNHEAPLTLDFNSKTTKKWLAHDLENKHVLKPNASTYSKRIAAIKKDNDKSQGSLLQKSIRGPSNSPTISQDYATLTRGMKSIGKVTFEQHALTAHGSTSNTVEQGYENKHEHKHKQERSRPEKALWMARNCVAIARAHQHKGSTATPSTGNPFRYLAQHGPNSERLGGMKFIALPFIDTTSAVSGIAAGRCFTLEDRPSSWPTLVSPFLFPVGRNEKIMASVDSIWQRHAKPGMIRVALWCKFMAASSDDNIWFLAEKRAIEHLKGVRCLVRFTGIAARSTVGDMVLKASGGLVQVVEGSFYCHIGHEACVLQDYASGRTIEEFLTMDG